VRAAQTEQSSGEAASPLFDSSETETFRARWHSIQTQFVDEPRKSVEQADELVAAAMKRLAEIFAGERENLEREWDRGEDVSTEDLRIALQRYRSFFESFAFSLVTSVWHFERLPKGSHPGRARPKTRLDEDGALGEATYG